jgi:hypothetical protein
MGTALGLPPPIAAPRPSRRCSTPEPESTRSADDRSASAAPAVVATIGAPVTATAPPAALSDAEILAQFCACSI